MQAQEQNNTNKIIQYIEEETKKKVAKIKEEAKKEADL